MKRSILIFPNFNNMNELQNIRKKYDSLYTHIKPHISLVFPFESDDSNRKVFDQVDNSLKYFKRFDVSFNHVSGDFGNGYVWLEANTGYQEIFKLHDVLYQNNLFSKFRNKTIKYIPHVTVAQSLKPQIAYNLAKKLNSNINNFRTTTTAISVEQILVNDDSKIIHTFKLK